MRYDNWDVILFPRDSHIPTQEFKTACYVAQDEYGRQLPTLTCYIASLPASSPFRISIHSWATKAKPTALIESRRKTYQRVVYTVQLSIDGARVFHDFYEVSCKWPQEIANEKRLIGYPEHPSSQRKPNLEFPPFSQNVLMRSSWDARENNGRIKVLLSEQLIGKTNSPGDLEFGATSDLVCFSFQHAPRDILEQAGISWPIRNPLYLPSTNDIRPPASQTPLPYTKPRNPTSEARVQSPLSKQSGTPFARPHNPEPFARPKTELPPQFSRFPIPPTKERGRPGASTRGESMTEPLGDSFDDVNMLDTWSTKRTSPNSTIDVSMPDLMFASPPSLTASWTWSNPPKERDEKRNKNWEEARQRNDRKERQVVVTLREDQFGQLIETLSPPKKGRNREPSPRRPDQDHSQSIQESSHTYPPKMGPTGIPINTRPSAAALARTASYPDFNTHLRDTSNRPSPAKEDDKNGPDYAQKSPGLYQSSFASGKENRMPTPFPFENRIPTPHPFAQNHVSGFKYIPPWESDVSMRDTSSLFSSLSRLEKAPYQATVGKSSPIPAPIASGSIKSRKEGRGIGSPAAMDHGNRHDKSLLPTLDTTVKEQGKVPHNMPITASPHTHIKSIINADENEPFVPGHRSGMDSLDSIGRVEKQLFSALGEELNTSFNDAGSPGPVSEFEDFDNSVTKRKRQGTMGGERGRSPMAKMLREEQAKSAEETNVPKMRSD